jgi:hypothetical protein
MKVGSPNNTRQHQANAGFNLPLPTSQAIYSNLAGTSVDWDMIEADLGARLDWNGVVEVQAPTGLARGYYLNSKFNTATVVSGGDLSPGDTKMLRNMALQAGARLNIFALPQNLVRLSIASSGWQIVREGRASEDFHTWAAELEANRGSGALEVSVLSGRRGILAFEFGARALTAFQALTSLSFDETALEWLNALAGRPDARVRWFGSADTAAFTGLETLELPPISVSARPAPMSAPVIRPATPQVVLADEADEMDLLELSDEISLTNHTQAPNVMPLSEPIVPVPVIGTPPVAAPLVPVVITAPDAPAPVTPVAVIPITVTPITVTPITVTPITVTPVALASVASTPIPPVPVAPVPIASVPVAPVPIVMAGIVEVPATPIAAVAITPVTIAAPQMHEPAPEITWPMVTAAWSELLAFTERRTDAARGAETFDRTWRESCIALAERYAVLDPFFADVKYAAGTLTLKAQTPSSLEALVAAYQRTLSRLSIPLEALEPLVQPIRARHQAVWAAAGLEALWRR